MRQLHVGMGETRGALTVFPIWGEFAVTSGYVWDTSVALVAEAQGGPTVACLQVSNPAPAPLLVFEGTILEGGWQNRMVAHSTLIPAASSEPVQVVCVEQGRWHGDQAHRSLGRRGSARVRLGLRDSADPQGAVWSRVAEYEEARGGTMTRSYVEHADRAAIDIATLTAGLRALPGQIGVVVAIAGQPVFAEVFPDDLTLAAQFEALVQASALDALGLPRSARPRVGHAASSNAPVRSCRASGWRPVSVTPCAVRASTPISRPWSGTTPTFTWSSPTHVTSFAWQCEHATQVEILKLRRGTAEGGIVS
ncbi:ARPP-1 family domain-containing protein [Nocardioides ultimimeridianus]